MDELLLPREFVCFSFSYHTPFFMSRSRSLRTLAFSSASLPPRHQWLNQFDRQPRCSAGLRPKARLHCFVRLVDLLLRSILLLIAGRFLSWKMIAPIITGCSRLVGFCRIFEHFSRFGFLLLPS